MSRGSVTWCLKSSMVNVRVTRKRMIESQGFFLSMESRVRKRQRKMAEEIIGGFLSTVIIAGLPGRSKEEARSEFRRPDNGIECLEKGVRSIQFGDHPTRTPPFLPPRADSRPWRGTGSGEEQKAGSGAIRARLNRLERMVIQPLAMVGGCGILPSPKHIEDVRGTDGSKEPSTTPLRV